MKIALALASSIVALAATSALAHERIYTAVLDGPSEFPANASPGTGFATVTLDLDLITMRVQADFTGLTGTVTAAHIHGPTLNPLAGTAGVMTTTPTFTGFPSGVTSGTYDHTFNMGLASSYNPSFISANGGSVGSAYPVLLAAFQDGKAYLNIHTSTFGGGEIRGFLVPEPTTLGALAGVGTLVLRRRR
ncbi:MAG TPA: CHRD domain-containing protein [Tepidisphaeraceae bacterium]|nr:CHRD domain-containing protein [Tepidisphaeraceae bacterium]